MRAVISTITPRTKRLFNLAGTKIASGTASPHPLPLYDNARDHGHLGKGPIFISSSASELISPSQASSKGPLRRSSSTDSDGCQTREQHHGESQPQRTRQRLLQVPKYVGQWGRPSILWNVQLEQGLSKLLFAVPDRMILQTDGCEFSDMFIGFRHAVCPLASTALVPHIYPAKPANTQNKSDSLK
jgi:hypothetical protein